MCCWSHLALCSFSNQTPPFASFGSDKFILRYGSTRKEGHISGWWWCTPDGDVSYGENGCGIQVLYVVVVFPVLLWRFSFLVMSVPLAWSWFKFYLDQGVSWIPLFCPPFALGSSLLGHFRIFYFTSAVAYQTNPTAALLSSNTYNTKLLESSGTFCFFLFFCFSLTFWTEAATKPWNPPHGHKQTLWTWELKEWQLSGGSECRCRDSPANWSRSAATELAVREQKKANENKRTHSERASRSQSSGRLDKAVANVDQPE